MICDFGDCETKAKYILRGHFLVNEEKKEKLCFCQSHYSKFIDVVPAEMLNILMELMPR